MYMYCICIGQWDVAESKSERSSKVQKRKFKKMFANKFETSRDVDFE